MAGDTTKTQEVQIEIDEAMREELGIVDLEVQIEELQRTVARLQNSLGEWLVYVNLMDRRVQALSGDPVVTETIAYHDRPDGDVTLTRQRPPVPPSIVNAAPKMAKRKE